MRSVILSPYKSLVIPELEFISNVAKFLLGFSFFFVGESCQCLDQKEQST